MTKIFSWLVLVLRWLGTSFAADAHAHEATTSRSPRASEDAVAPTVEYVARREGKLRLLSMDTVNVRVNGRGESIELRRPDSALVAEWRKRAAASDPSMRRERPPSLVGVRANQRIDLLRPI